MEKHLIMLQSPLFQGIAVEDLENMLHCLDAHETHYAPKAGILLAGQKVQQVGLLLNGQAQVLREEYSGTRTIVTALRAGDLFAEAFAYGPETQAVLPVTVMAVTACTVLFLDVGRLLTTCTSACPFHNRLIANLVTILASKNRLLNARLGHLSQRTTREKLLSYLMEQAMLQKSTHFAIPFNRQELADYLCVERSAMSAVLSQLRGEGILTTDRQIFYLHMNEKRPGDMPGPG